MRTKQSIGATAIHSGEGPYMGIKWDMLAGMDVEDFEAAITDKTHLIFIKVLYNPTLGVPDLGGICKMAHAKVKCSASVEAEHQDKSEHYPLRRLQV